jgi:hypothetical protein
MPTLFRRNEKSEIDEAEIQAFRHRVGCACCLATPDWLIAPFGTPAADFGGRAREQRRRRIRQFKGEIRGSKNRIFLGIKLELAESPV